MRDRINDYEPLWGEWYIDEMIGEGSFGKVYRVKRIEFGEEYYAAVKIITIPQNDAELRHAYSEGMDLQSVKSYFENFVRDLLNEIKLMSNLKGVTNIVNLEDHKIIERQDTIGWDILIRMELLKSLPDYLIGHPLTISDIIRLGIDICRALELCEKYNIIHRDIKPDNIFVSQHGDFKLGDFGIARQIEKTMTGLSKKGTFSYMAPEVYKGQPYNSSVDIYSLGLVLYRFLNNNRTPFLPDYPAPITHIIREEALIRRIRGEALPKPANAEGRLSEIILKAASYDPKERYESPGQMCEELQAILYSKKQSEFIYPKDENIEIIHDDYSNKSSEKKPVEKEEGVTEKIEGTQTIYENIDTGHIEAEESKHDKASVKRKKRGWIIGAVSGVSVMIIALFIIFLKPQFTINMSSMLEGITNKSNNAEEMGNTAGNIHNGGISSTQNGRIYYSNIGDDSKLFKMHSDGTGNQLLCEDKSYYLNVIGDWIYYSNWSDKKKLYKIRNDGRDKQKVSDDSFRELIVVGEWIYYIDDFNGKFYRMLTDGTGKKKLSDDVCLLINITGNWIYYINGSDGDKLYRMNINGSDRKSINNEDFQYINIVEDWIYYSSKSDNDKLYKMRIDGTQKQKLNDEASYSINVNRDCIYYLDDNDNLYRISTGGYNKQIIIDEPVKNINVVGDWVYYVNKNDNKLYMIRTYGTQKLEVGAANNNEVSTNSVPNTNTKSKVEIRGNTTGNISCFGSSAMLGDYIYISYGSSLFKISKDGKSKEVLSDDEASSINVIGDWIYYSNWDDYEKLYRIKTDGTGRQKLNEVSSKYINVVGDWIYYSAWSGGNGLYKMRTDGTNREMIFDDSAESVNVVGDWIYYSNKDDDGKLYKIHIKGTGRQKLADDVVWFVNVVDDWIYYSNESDKYSIYKVRTDGTGRKKINNDETGFVNVVGNWIFYENRSDNEKLYKTQTDGTNRRKLNDEQSNYINIVGDWIYYYDNSGKNSILYRIHTDGTDKESVKVFE